jgi:hypothetical protein
MSAIVTTLAVLMRSVCNIWWHEHMRFLSNAMQHKCGKIRVCFSGMFGLSLTKITVFIEELHHDPRRSRIMHQLPLHRLR